MDINRHKKPFQVLKKIDQFQGKLDIFPTDYFDKKILILDRSALLPKVLAALKLSGLVF